MTREVKENSVLTSERRSPPASRLANSFPVLLGRSFCTPRKVQWLRSYEFSILLRVICAQSSGSGPQSVRAVQRGLRVLVAGVPAGVRRRLLHVLLAVFRGLHAQTVAAARVASERRVVRVVAVDERRRRRALFLVVLHVDARARRARLSGRHSTPTPHATVYT